MSKKSSQILAAPETNLFLFAFLLNFVYEVWQAPYYEFYANNRVSLFMIVDCSPVKVVKKTPQILEIS